MNPRTPGGNDPGTKPGSPDNVIRLRKSRVLRGAVFMQAYEPPDWLVQGIVQNGRLYACTSLTGHGKTAVWLHIACMIQASRYVGSIETDPGNVLILAGENPQDLQARMHGMAREFGLTEEQMPYVLPGNFPMTPEEAEALQQEIADMGIPFCLIIGDTAASFFPGDEENSNTQNGDYARTLRTFTEVPGKPALIALCHPTKHADRYNLLPRGGGAFLNELDGNLTLWSAELAETTTLHWFGKIRGPDFKPIEFGLRSVKTGYVDKKKRPVMTIIAEPMSDEEAADRAQTLSAEEDAVLIALRDHPQWNMSDIARDRGWIDGVGDPLNWKVGRICQRMAEAKMVEKHRKRGHWKITETGLKTIRSLN